MADYQSRLLGSGDHPTSIDWAAIQQQYAVSKGEYQAGNWQRNMTLTNLAGTTSGSIQYAMPEKGTLKVFVAYANNYKNASATAQVITFPTPFTLGVTVLSSAGMVLTVSNTQLTLPANESVSNSGVILLIGL